MSFPKGRRTIFDLLKNGANQVGDWAEENAQEETALVASGANGTGSITCSGSIMFLSILMTSKQQYTQNHKNRNRENPKVGISLAVIDTKWNDTLPFPITTALWLW